MRQIKRTLGNRALRWLLASQVPADFADWLDFVAIAALLSFAWNAEPVAFAFLAVCLGLPYLIVGPPAGVFVDRMNIKTVLMAANLGRAAATACLVFAPNWQVLVLVVFLRSSVDAFYAPAKQAAIRAIVAPGLLMSANGVSGNIILDVLTSDDYICFRGS